MATSTSDTSWDIRDLCDVVRFCDLPKTVAVTRGSYVTSGVRISQGDIILLRSDFPKYLSIGVIDVDAASKRVMTVSPDCQVKFNVMPPKDSNSESEFHNVMYPTISDLVRDCPTYFQATVNFDEPYLPGCSIKAGDKFRFVRIIQSPDNAHIRLECIDEADNMLRLSGDCRGQFNPLADDMSYTLRELVNMARVSRRIKISSENMQLKLIASNMSEINITDSDKCCKTNTSASEINKNAQSSDTTADRSPLPGLPVTFKGVLILNIPETTLEVSPWNNLDVRWYIPNDVRLSVRLYSPNDYEVPVQRKQKYPSMNIYEFVNRYEKLPIVATLMNCNDISRDLVCYLRNVSDVIVHKTKNVPCLIVKSVKNEHFLITPNVHVTFVDYPRSYAFVFELSECSLGSQIRIMEDVASDFPYPYSLRHGDVIKLTRNKPCALKMKRGPVPVYQVLHCEKLNDAGDFVKLILPIDLEVKMFELTDMTAQKLYKLSDILSGSQKLPTGLVSVMEEDKISRLPLPPVVTLLDVVRDEVALISPLRRTEEGTIEPLVKTCIALPIRHPLLLSFSKELELPTNYFVLPRAKNRKNILVEQICKGTAGDLLSKRRATTSYEDINFGPELPLTESVSANSLDPMRFSRAKRRNRSLRRISRIFTNVFNRKSRAIPDEVPTAIAASETRAEDNFYTDPDDVGGSPASPTSPTSPLYDDENNYEFVDVHAHGKKKSPKR